MIVQGGDFEVIVKYLAGKSELAFDLETTGLGAFTGSQLFAVVFADSEDEYYFNFNRLVSNPEDAKYEAFSFDRVIEFQEIFDRGLRFAQNAKFDMNFLSVHGIEFHCEIHDTEVGGRLIYNQHKSYSLDYQVKRDLGKAKDDRVKLYMEEHGLYDSVVIQGKETKLKNYFFNRVPIDIISTYAKMDARLTFDLAKFQIAKLEEMAKETDPEIPSILNVYKMEKELTPVCHRMEKRGIKMDLDFVRKALDFETKRGAEAALEFQNISGQELTNSGTFLAPYFENLGYKIELTEKGNPEITDDFLAKVTHPEGAAIRKYRDASKRASTYFSSFLQYGDEDAVIHANMRQAGTVTGRFAYMNPNLQNLTKDDDGEFPIRRSFIPRDGYYFVMIDYQAMEFRMMLDYAGEMKLIEAIKSGLDPHQATANITGLTRPAAKTLNFGLLYGMGIQKLADALGCTYEEAKAFKEKYFDGLPNVERLIYVSKSTASGRGWVFDWMGRRSYFDDPRFSYRAVNSVIQGGCASVVKKAMVELSKILPEYDIHMVLQIHDELVFEVPIGESAAVYKIKALMESVYPYRHLPLTCSVSHSLISLGDPVEGLPSEATGNQIQGTSH